MWWPSKQGAHRDTQWGAHAHARARAENEGKGAGAGGAPTSRNLNASSDDFVRFIGRFSLASSDM